MSVEKLDFEGMDKKAKKAALKKEAERQGISYDEMKKKYKESSSGSKVKRKKTSEADLLESDEHKKDIKRMRSYSKDLDEKKENEPNSKRRRTRSMDEAEEAKVKTNAEKSLTVEEWRKEQTITLRGHGQNTGSKTFAAPYIEFSDAPFSPRIQKTLLGAGFARPTSIQAQAWPLAVEGKDLISIAKTGSGKTCGFLLPVFHHHDQTKSGRSGGYTKPILLVLAPTRELCVQISEESQKFGRPLGIRSVCCYGGSSKYPQIQALQRGVECIIACPGRLNDLIEMRKCDLSNIKYLVLDEADRMLDMVRTIFLVTTSSPVGLEMLTILIQFIFCMIIFFSLRVSSRKFVRSLRRQTLPTGKRCCFRLPGRKKFNN
jgi:ATP-dependent RNA helicase DDX5/DBP2